MAVSALILSSIAGAPAGPRQAAQAALTERPVTATGWVWDIRRPGRRAECVVWIPRGLVHAVGAAAGFSIGIAHPCLLKLLPGVLRLPVGNGRG